MKISKTLGTVTGVVDLTASAREVQIQLQDEIDVVSGSFINIFFEINGEKIRRAYSISSDPKEKKNICLSIRKKTDGTISPYFWNEKIIGTTFEVMGPLGLNTYDKLSKEKLFLVGFGIGVSVIKSILHSALSDESVKEIHIITASRDESEILYKEFFNADTSNKIKSVKNVLSQPINKDYLYTGYVLDHIKQYDFNNADIYICGMEIACESLKKEIENKECSNSDFFIEGFH